MDCSLPGSSFHGILQVRILEWVTFPFSRGSSQLWDQTQVSRIADEFFTVRATREAHLSCNCSLKVLIKIMCVHLKLTQHCELLYLIKKKNLCELWLLQHIITIEL